MAIPNISHILVKHNTILSNFTCIFTFNSHNNTVRYYYLHEAKQGWLLSNSVESQTRLLGLSDFRDVLLNPCTTCVVIICVCVYLPTKLGEPQGQGLCFTHPTCQAQSRVQKT